jgi:DNA-binding transcriptional LysR family regulator
MRCCGYRPASGCATPARIACGASASERSNRGPVLAVNDYLHLRWRALHGDLVTELPPFLAAEALRDGRLVALLPDHPFPEQQVSLLYQRQPQSSRVVRAYLDYCHRVVGRYLGEE